MKSYDRFKNNNLEYLKKAIELWKTDERGLDDVHVKNHINNANHALNNIDECTKNEIARYAVLCSEPFATYSHAIETFEINKDEDNEIYKALSDVVNKQVSISFIRDKFIQKIADYYKIEIPLLEDLENDRIKFDSLNAEYAKVKYDNPNYRIESKLLELEEQIKIKEVSLGLGNSTISGGFTFKEDVIDRYSKKKEELEHRFKNKNINI